MPDGEYMDTTVNSNIACKDYNVYYYQVGGKYPKSSITLLKDAQTFLQHTNKIYQGNGYITFRFKIDCEGHRIKRTQVLQTDENHKSYHFDKELVNELYLFLNTLDEWKVAKDSKGNSFSYIAFITCKIKNGKVINIIP
ncbi:MAG: hypothetical protein WKG06_30840 [Segetibacter sp.]